MILLAKSTGGRYIAVGCAADRLKIFHLNEKKDGTKYLVNLGGAYFVHMFNDETIRVIELLYPQVNWQTANDDEWPEEITKQMVEDHEKTQRNEPFSLLRPIWRKES